MSQPPPLDPGPPQSTVAAPRRRVRLEPRAVITGVLFVAIIGLAIWYLARPEPLLVQGEAESTRIDIAARVSGRLAKIEVSRGQNVAAGATLLVIDIPNWLPNCGKPKPKKWWQMRSCCASRSERGPKSLPSARPRSTAP